MTRLRLLSTLLETLIAVALLHVPMAVAAPLLTLEEALRTARQKQPQLRQARASVEAARARVDQARSSLLPQVNGTGSYERTTANFAPRPGVVPQAITSAASASVYSTRTFNYFALGLTGSWLAWDSLQTWQRWRAAGASAEAQQRTSEMTEVQVLQTVRSAYFSARAQRALVKVARDQLTNQDHHLTQIEAFVKVGTRPEIDLAQVRSDRANAVVSLINAENNYAVGRAQLNQAMGVAGSTEYEVADEVLPPIAGEDLSADSLVAEAQRARPDLQSLERQIAADELTVRAARAGYWPRISLSTSVTDEGTEIDHLAWNWNATATLTWPIFQGGLTRGQVREAEANLSSLVAQRDTLLLQVRVDVKQALLGVRAARAGLSAASEALTNAAERMRLAEGRYQAGVGNIIELSDAQVALTNAAAQRVQSEYNLATARAALLRALGRR